MPAFSKVVGVGAGLVFLVQFLVIWLTPFFYTQDGPAHVYGATVLLELLFHPESSVAEVYCLSEWYVPTWIGSLVLAGCVHLLGPLAGEKAFICLTMASIAGGFWYFLGAVHPRARWGWVLVLPFLMNHLLMMGLYFFLLATGVGLFLLGWAWNRRCTLSWSDTGLISGGFLICFLIHPVPPALVGCALLIQYLVPRKGERSWKDRLWPAARLTLAGFPCAVWSLIFIASSDRSGPVAPGSGFVDVVSDVASVAVLAPFSKSPHFWAVLCFALMTIFSLWCLAGWIRARRSERQSLILLVLGVCLFVLSAIVPEGITGGTLMGYRIGFLFWLVWLVWLVDIVEQIDWGMARWALILAFMVAAMFQAVHIRERQAVLQPSLAALKSVSSAIPEKARVWPLTFNPQGKTAGGELLAPRNNYLVHAGLRFLDARNGQVATIAYQGEVGHFATRFRDSFSNEFFRHGLDEKPESYRPDCKPGDVILSVGVGGLNFEALEGAREPLRSESTLIGTITVVRCQP